MRKLLGLLRAGGVLALSLRHGPAEPARAMHPVSLAEVERLAREYGAGRLRLPPGPTPHVIDHLISTTSADANPDMRIRRQRRLVSAGAASHEPDPAWRGIADAPEPRLPAWIRAAHAWNI